MKVAAVQFRPEFGAVDRNISSCLDLSQKAIQNGARLVVLPELALSGYSMMSSREARRFLPKVSELKGFQDLADKNNSLIALGTIMTDDWGALYNGQVMFVPRRDFVYYHKMNFWGQDWLWASDGRLNPPIVPFEGRRVGLLICADVRDGKPDPWKGDIYEPGDADIVAFSTNWGKGAFPSGRWIKFARDNKTSLVAGNRYGTERNNDFGMGGVCVIDEKGRVSCEGLEWGQDCIVYAEL